MRWLLISLACIALIASGSVVAYAKPRPPGDSDLTADGSGALARAWKASRESGKSTRGSSRRSASGTASKRASDRAPEATWNSTNIKRVWDAGTQQLSAKAAAYRADLSAYDKCVAVGGPCRLPLAQAPNNQPGNIAISLTDSAQIPAPIITITPEQAAYVAVARLNLTPPTPGIGPPPSINQWKMAAVGYPLWLWADGDTSPAPSTDSVAGLSVSLNAHVDRVVFLMGDGTSKICQGTGTRWTLSVAPGAESPTCGYRYQKPSLPKGTYTVTAQTRWTVDWQINGVTGSIPIVQEASTQLPVGELQSLVR